MKKKFVTAFLLIALSTLAVACGEPDSEGNKPTQSSEDTSNNKSEENKESEPGKTSEPEENKNDESSNSHTIDGITISASTFSIEPYEDNTGKYTRRIVLNFSIKNDSDKAFGYLTSWEGKLSDGYKLEGWMDIMSMNLKQVASGSEKTDSAYFLIDDSIDPTEIIVTYNFQDYGEEYWEDFGKIMSGKMGQEEYMSKWGKYEVLEFTVLKE